MLLITELITAKEETFNAQETIDYLQLRLYGQNRERFTDPEQTKLFDDYIPEVHAPESEEEEEFVKKRCRRPRGLYSGRNKDLPRVIIPIDPEGDLSYRQKIGEEVHSVLHFQPACFVILQYVHKKYEDPNNKDAGILMGTLPDNVKGKRSATAETLTEVVISKYVDHLPIDLTGKQFLRLGADLPNSTLNDFCAHVANDLKSLHELLRQEVLHSEYIQADETRISVRDPVKSKESGKNHLGCTLHRLLC